MGLKCRISYDTSGTATVYNEDGEVSRLYDDILTEVGNQSTALDLWAVSQTEEFKESIDGYVTAEEVIKYADTESSQHTQLTDSQKVAVKSILETSGIERLSDLNQKLIEAFKPNGVFDFNPRRAEESGLYTEEELKNLDQVELQKVMTSIEGQLQLYDIEVDASEQATYVNTESKDILGRFKRVNQEQVDREVNQLADLANDELQLQEALMELPYREFVDQFIENEEFRQQTIQRLKRLTVIPELYYDGDDLVQEDLSGYSKVRNTIDLDADVTSVSANLQILEEMSPVGWDQQSEVKDVLRSISEEMVSYRVDLAGLENLSNEPDQVLSLLRAAELMLDKPTKQNIQNFVAVKQEYLPDTRSKRVENLPAEYLGYNIVSVRTAKTDQSLFEDGLIRVGEDLYHKVTLEDKSVLYDYVYDMYVRGDFNIPDHMKTVRTNISDFNNKIAVLRDLEKYINSRDTGLKVDDQELLSLYQVSFGHKPLVTENSSERVKPLSSIVTEGEYLKGDFINDFYEYYLEEKIKGSSVYDNILSKFEFNSKGLSITEEVSSLDNLKYSTEIKDYIRVRKDLASEPALMGTSGNTTKTELMALNFPKEVAEYSGPVATEGMYAVIPVTEKEFYRIDGKLYRNMMSDMSQSLLMEVAVEDNTIFYEIDPDFSFDSDQAQDVMDRLEVNPEQMTQDQVSQVFKDSRFNNKFKPGGMSLNQMRSGRHTLETNDTLYKGVDGKEDLGGQRINAHQGVEGVFAATDIKLAEEYGAVSTINVPAGTTVEVIEVSPKGKTPDAYRQAEVEAINNSDAQIVKLRTMDGIMRQGQRLQEQYILKDDNLIQLAFEESDLNVSTSQLKELSQNSVDILNSEIKVLDLYSAEEETSVKDEFNECG